MIDDICAFIRLYKKNIVTTASMAWNESTMTAFLAALDDYQARHAATLAQADAAFDREESKLLAGKQCLLNSSAYAKIYSYLYFHIIFFAFRFYESALNEKRNAFDGAERERAVHNDRAVCRHWNHKCFVHALTLIVATQRECDAQAAQATSELTALGANASSNATHDADAQHELNDARAALERLRETAASSDDATSLTNLRAEAKVRVVSRVYMCDLKRNFVLH